MSADIHGKAEPYIRGIVEPSKAAGTVETGLCYGIQLGSLTWRNRSRYKPRMIEPLAIFSIETEPTNQHLDLSGSTISTMIVNMMYKIQQSCRLPERSLFITAQSLAKHYSSLSKQKCISFYSAPQDGPASTSCPKSSQRAIQRQPSCAQPTASHLVPASPSSLAHPYPKTTYAKPLPRHRL